jgi:DNA-directed RNA polymerase subunit E'/Rpb7
MGKRERTEDFSEGVERARKAKKESKMRRKENGLPVVVVPVFLEKKLELIVSILPAGLHNVRKSIEENLRLFLLRFTDGMGGILLAFNNLKIAKGGRGEILNELPYIHYTVQCDALIFCPAKGGKLSGVVTESFHSHVSLVVHHYFNASISEEHLRSSGFEYDNTDDRWKHGKTKAGLDKDKKVDFLIDKVHESGGIISVDGSQPAIPTVKSK